MKAALAERTDGVMVRAALRSAFHERVLVVYIVGLLVAVACGSGARRGDASLWLALDLGLLVAAITAVRAQVVRNAFFAALLARFIVLWGLIGTFIQLQIILPAARNGSVDTALQSIDKELFGVEPSTAWDCWVTPTTTEWFSFFYFSYFVLLALHVLPFVFLERRLALVGELTLGMVALYCIGQFTYTIVPGFGPYQTLTFQHELSGATWWPLVQSGAVAIDEANRSDIFPSLHTGGPVFLTLFSFRHRRQMPFRYTWPILAFFSVNIALATMFLRWHYLIDVVAGVSLALVAAKLCSRAPAHDAQRAALGYEPVWTVLRWRDR